MLAIMICAVDQHRGFRDITGGTVEHLIKAASQAPVRGFLLAGDRIRHDLVVTARRVKEFLVSQRFTDRHLQRVHFLDFAPHGEPRLLHNLSDMFVISSPY